MTKWDVYWFLISRISLVVLIVIRACFLCRLVRPFLAGEKTGRRNGSGRNIKYFPDVLLPGIVYAAVMLGLAFWNREVNVILAYMAGTAAAFGMMYFIDQRNLEQKIFLALTFYLLQWITWGITLVPWKGLYDFLLAVSGRPKNYLLQFVIYAAMECFNLVLHCFAMAVCVRMIHKEYHYKTENMTRRELALMSAPLLSVAAGQGMFYFVVDAYEKDTGRYIWNHYSVYTLIQAVFMVISFAAMLTVIVSCQRIRASQRREKVDAVLSGQIAEMKRHIREVEKLYFDIRSLKHDMGNHIMTLEKLCEKNEAAGNYIAQWKEQVRETVPKRSSGNPVIDVILQEKQKEAEEKKIGFTHRFYFPEDTKLSAFDVSVILNNALNNAMEAAEKCEKPYISVSSCRRKNACMIEVKNSAAEKRRIDEESGLPLTTKKGTDHGFGLVNIRRVAQKYYGDIAIEQEDGSFRLVVMLMV